MPITEQTELAGAVLLVGHDAAISHESALVLNDLTDANPAKVNVTVPSAYRARRSELERIKIWRDDLARSDIRFVEGIRATTLWRTIRDCHVTGTDPTNNQPANSHSPSLIRSHEKEPHHEHHQPPLSGLDRG